MKRSLLLSLVILAASPLPAIAQQTPLDGAPGFATPSPQMFAAMQQSRAQLQQLRVQARSRMLASLTPAHRALVANIVGQLTLSVDPNPRAAAAQLDTVFAPAEKQAIVNIDAAVRTNARAIFERQHAAMEATLTPDQRAHMAQRHAKMEALGAQALQHRPAPDPGAIVLRTLGNFNGDEMHFHRGGPPMAGG